MVERRMSEVSVLTWAQRRRGRPMRRLSLPVARPRWGWAPGRGRGPALFRGTRGSPARAREVQEALVPGASPTGPPSDAVVGITGTGC